LYLTQLDDRHAAAATRAVFLTEARAVGAGGKELLHGAPERARPEAVDDAHLGQAETHRAIEEPRERVDAFTHALPDQVDLTALVIGFDGADRDGRAPSLAGAAGPCETDSKGARRAGCARGRRGSTSWPRMLPPTTSTVSPSFGAALGGAADSAGAWAVIAAAASRTKPRSAAGSGRARSSSSTARPFRSMSRTNRRDSSRSSAHRWRWRVRRSDASASASARARSSRSRSASASSRARSSWRRAVSADRSLGQVRLSPAKALGDLDGPADAVPPRDRQREAWPTEWYTSS
jgi:hypothetical protein